MEAFVFSSILCYRSCYFHCPCYVPVLLPSRYYTHGVQHETSVVYIECRVKGGGVSIMISWSVMKWSR